MIGIIAAVSANGVIGIVENGVYKLPFSYKEDMEHFKKTTLNTTIIMGKNTFNSIGKPLPKRRNIVISSNDVDMENVETFRSIKEALNNCNEDIWFIGGEKIYQEAMRYADTILLTLTPDIIDSNIKFPFINPLNYKLEYISYLNQNCSENLRLAKYSKSITND
jgi:dihydrofolate reductase